MIWKTFTMEILRNLFLIFILTLLVLRFLGSAVSCSQKYQYKF